MSEPATLACPHVGDAAVEPRGDACESCGSSFNLRACTQCGHVGCCESQLAHNTAHYRDSGHAVIRSMPIGAGSFTWCYECGRYL
ncbi:MAG TPA: UBP-type zinc finger domain-containing protein [Actinomycetota bacterium]|nr:UBP-type zinc finger domain-containing protein [Actinomycetota bacterium]